MTSLLKPASIMANPQCNRATPLTEEDLAQPGEDLTAWRALTLTKDYRDYHRLLNIDRMLTDLTPVVELIADADLATEVRMWLGIQPELNPVPTLSCSTPGRPVNPSQLTDHQGLTEIGASTSPAAGSVRSRDLGDRPLSRRA
jgi:hypothetical protein